MKTLYFLLFLLITQKTFSQNYEIVKLNQDIYYLDSSGYFSYSSIHLSPIEVMHYDTFLVNGTDTEYTSFPTWRDTVLFGMDTCVILNGTTWSGRQILKNGQTMIIGDKLDTVYYNTQAGVGASWVFYNVWYDSSTVRATVDSIVWMTYSGITDSVKCISLQGYDFNGNPNQTLFDKFTILLSKNNGVLKYAVVRSNTLNPYFFVQIPPVPMISLKDVYDFSIGDEFEVIYKCIDIFWTGPPPGYDYKRITNKWYSPVGDTVYYEYTDSLGNIGVDHYYIDTLPLYSVRPEENILSSSLTYIDSYSLRLLNQRQAYCSVWGYMYGTLADTCYKVNHFEPVYFNIELARGLGKTNDEFNFWSQAGNDCYQRLIWYRKGAETWGTYIPIINSVDDMEANIFNVFPNPASDQFQIHPSVNEKYKFELCDLTGKVVFRDQATGIHQFNVSDLTSGFYLLKIEMSGQVFYEEDYCELIKLKLNEK